MLRVYSRPDCHLCDDLMTALAGLPAARDVGVEVVDITGNLVLERDYGTRIPVVELDGRELCRYHLDADRVTRALGEARRSSPADNAGAR